MKIKLELDAADIREIILDALIDRYGAVELLVFRDEDGTIINGLHITAEREWETK